MMNTFSRKESALPTPSYAHLQQELRMQLEFIANSCGLYDEGDTQEALRIAPAAAAILYPDTRLNYFSLAKRLLKNHWPFLELFSTNKRNYDVHHARQDTSAFLLLLSRLSEDYFLPLLDGDSLSQACNGELNYLRWLDQPIIYFHYQNHFHSYTREQVIRLAAAKLIPILVPAYLKQNFFLHHPQAKVIKVGKCSITLMDIFTASLRQIGYELLRSHALNALTGDKIAA
jgi:hypothetical protein